MAKFSVVMLVCADITRSRDFYRDVLELPVLQDLPKRPVRFALGGGAVLSLHRKSDVLAVRPGSLQLGFIVANVDEFVSGCVARRVPVFQDPYDEPFGRIAIVGDPDGYPLQVATLKKR
jgi:catechol 2,3-dioxygenase-like lactoylglutathione lyase family enzyme